MVSTVLIKVNRTFVNFDFDGQQKDNHCGPRCAIVYGVSLEENRPNKAILINCNITVLHVRNAPNASYEMSDRVARLAAGAIGLDGTRKFKTNRTVYQYSRYNNR